MSNAAQPGLDTLLAHRNFVRGVAARLLNDPSDVDAVEQETWISSLGAAGNPPREWRAWLGQVVRNHALNLLRGRKRAALRERTAAREEAVEGSARVAQRVDTARFLVEQVMSLPEKNRTVLLLRYYEDLSVRSIAKHLDVSPQTVKGRIQRGLAELRAGLESSGHGERSWRDELSALVAVPTSSLMATKIGLVAGAVLLGGGAWLVRSLDKGGLQSPEPASVAATPALTPLPTKRGGDRRTDAVAGGLVQGSARQPFETKQAPGGSELRGQVTLRIGEAFVFGSGPQPDGDRDTLDLLCQDIRHGASLACFAGSVAATSPHTSIGLPTEPLEAFELLPKGPQVLPKRDLWLLEQCTVERTGVGFVRARNGLVYKLCLADFQPHPEALERSVTIRYEAVDTAEDGGAFALPDAAGKPSGFALRAIETALQRGATIPGQNFHHHLRGDYAQVEGLAAEVTLEQEEYLVAEHPLQSSLALGGGGALFAAAGVAASGRVDLRSYSALGVTGPMDGLIEVNSYGYVYVDGPMNGTIEVDSYATVYLAQGLRGTLKVRSYTDLFVAGPVLGTIDAKGSCWSTFYFDGHFPSYELESMGDALGQITLHVRSSDLPDGEHSVGSWRKVIVGDPFWGTIR